jgi:MinD-like ATPase involved in chromosome partitioning or flagellar assembly
MNSGHPGEIVTFYSYKGGVGRSMAVANTAALLAQDGCRVLVVDFDLEAPGLHRYFLPSSRIPAADASEPVIKKGTIELFHDLEQRMRDSFPASEILEEPAAEAAARTTAAKIITELLDSGEYVYNLSLHDPNYPTAEAPFWFMAAGRFDESYPERVRDLDWRAINEDFSFVFALLAQELSRRYAYVLIDSRTGITDAASVCTALLPTKLVLVFSPNEQSLHGALQIGRQAALYRAALNSSEPTPLFPLLSRVENAEEDLTREWLADSRRRFEQLFRDLYGPEHADLGEYFERVRIPHKTYYAFGEKIAAERHKSTESQSLTEAFVRFVKRLRQDGAAPRPLVAALTASAAFLSIAGLKSMDGPDVHAALSALHRVLRTSIAPLALPDIRVLSSLTGAIVLVPDALNRNLHDLLPTWLAAIDAAGLSMRAGVARGVVEMIADADGTVNAIGRCINVAARLAMSERNPGVLYEEAYAAHVQSMLLRTHFLHPKKRVPVQVKGKRTEVFTCFADPDIIPRAASDIGSAGIPAFVNAVLIAYDLPDFSDGDLRTLASRFRAVVQEVQRLREEHLLPEGAGVSFSPGGDGGVLSLTQVPLGRAFGLATDLASLLEAAGTTQSAGAPVRARIGVHYGQVLPYENAEGVSRPTGLALFDADGLAGDAEARRHDAVVVSGALIESASDGARKLEASRFQEIAPMVTPHETTIRRFVARDAAGRGGAEREQAGRASARHVDREDFLATCTPVAGGLFTFLLDEAARRGLPIYWGTTGFSTGAQVPGGADRWTFAYGFPPDDFRFYFEEGAPWSSGEEGAAFRKELMSMGIFREAGRLTLKSRVDDRTIARAREAARRILERVEESIQRASAK